MIEPLLDIQQLSIRFPGALRPAVDDIALQILPGSTLGLVGESGSGKSVTALSLLRLVPGATIGGRLIWQDADRRMDLLQVPQKEIYRYRGSLIGMVFQEPMTALNPVFTCGSQIAEAIQMQQQCSAAEAKAQTLEWLNEVQISDAARVYQAYPHELSGGQKQRILIAMAMAGKPRLIVADEPTTALDVGIQRAVLDLLLQLKERYRQSMLFISHDLGVINQVADRVAVMQSGTIVESGTTQEVLRHPQHPYTKSLLASRPSIHRRYRRLPTFADPVEPQLVGPAEKALRQARIEAQPVLLEVRELHFAYPKRASWLAAKQWTPVLTDINFKIRNGVSFGLVGASGSGKTTLGRCIAGQLEAPPATILWPNRQELNAANDMHRMVQMVFQDPYSSLNPRMTAGSAIMEPLAVHGIESNAARRRDRAAALLELVGLEADHLDHLPHQFSGGQRQRICIARALAVQPRLLVCDEITSALDVSVQATILNLLADLQEKLQLSYLFISHDLSLIHQMCDEVMVLHNGRCEAIDQPDRLFASAPTPYVRQLIEAVPELT